MKIWWIKVIAAGYLLYMVWDYFRSKDKDDNKDNNIDVAVQKGFWVTVASVELMDISFSIDSVAAAFGVSSEVWVLFIGAIFGILAMRGVAKVFVNLIEKIPELETASYILIAIIGVKMLLGIVGLEISNVVFFLILIAVFGATVFIHKMKKTSSERIKE